MGAVVAARGANLALDFQAARWLIAKDVPARPVTTTRPAFPPGYFPTRDGHINIAAAGKHIFDAFAGRSASHLLDDPPFSDEASRSKNRLAINRIISEVTSHSRAAN